MLGIIASGLRGVSGIARAAFQGSANAARVASEGSFATVSTLVAPILHLANHSGQMVVNGSGQVLQLPGAGAAAAASAAGSLPSLSLPSGGEALAVPAAAISGGGAGAMASAAGAPMSAPMNPQGPTEFLGAIRPQGLLPLMPQGPMRIS